MDPRILLLTLLVTTPAAATAADTTAGNGAPDKTRGVAPHPGGPRLGLHLGLEHFTWTEQDPDTSRELLEEEGPRFAATVTLDNFLKAAEGPIYALEARGYLGEVNYDGETQSGTPFNTEVTYAGTLGEVRAGYRFVVDWASYGFDVLGGLGGEYWTRDIQDGYDANNNFIGGYEEAYTVAYARAGLGVADLGYEEWFGRLEAGVRYPLEVDEQVDALNADLSPDPELSLYAAYEISKAIGGGRQLGLTLYYDAYRFGESPPASSNIGTVIQPESDMDVFGLRFGLFL